jgi:hypothetical protein
MIGLRYQTRYPSPWAWQVHGFAFALSLACVVLAAPFAASPADAPLPIADPSKIETHLYHQRVLAAKLEPELTYEVLRGIGGPHFDLRALGAAIRAYGRAEVDDDRSGVAAARTKILAAAAQARRSAADDLPAFRAYQAELFLRELRAWERVGVPSADLEELGGAFLATASRHGWIGPGRELLMNEAVRTIFFERRWNEITGLSDPKLSLSLDEMRAFYAFLLTPRRMATSSLPRTPERRLELSYQNGDEWRLRKIEELEHLDRAYPAGLARGTVLYQLGRYRLAEKTLGQHLAAAPDGPYSVRARNGWLAARARVPIGEQE